MVNPLLAKLFPKIPSVHTVNLEALKKEKKKESVKKLLRRLGFEFEKIAADPKNKESNISFKLPIAISGGLTGKFIGGGIAERSLINKQTAKDLLKAQAVSLTGITGGISSKKAKKIGKKYGVVVATNPKEYKKSILSTSDYKNYIEKYKNNPLKIKKAKENLDRFINISTKQGPHYNVFLTDDVVYMPRILRHKHTLGHELGHAIDFRRFGGKKSGTLKLLRAIIQPQLLTEHLAYKHSPIPIPSSSAIKQMGMRQYKKVAAGRGIGIILGAAAPLAATFGIKKLFEKTAAEYAPGLPDKSRFDRIDQKGESRVVVQKHKATTDHYDMRLQDGDIAHSWVVRSLPGEKDRMLAIRQPTHTAAHMDFEGRIAEGYGAGDVKKVYDKSVDVLEGNDKRVKMMMPEGEYTMIHVPKMGDNKWLMIRSKQPIKNPQKAKPSYKDKSGQEIDFEDDTKVLQPKVDGGHTVFRLNSDDINRIYSYRVSKETGEPIDHTHQVSVLRDAAVPKELDGTELRGELYAKKRDGTPMEAHEVGGLLNAGFMKSRINQGEKGNLLPYMFDVVKWKGKNVENANYAEKLKMLRHASSKVKPLVIAETARTPEEKRRLFNEIQQRQHPDTKEGVVEWDLNAPTGDPAKYKLRDTHEVVIRKIYPAITTKTGKKMAGGFEYSWKPEGPIVGKVGTGFSEQLRKEMLEDPKKFVNRIARIKTQQVFESGAARAPSFYEMHVEKNLEKGAAVRRNEMKEKINAPTFAYQTVYGKDPETFLMGRTNEPKKEWHGILVDKGLKNKWLERLNNLPVEIRSTDEGKSSTRPAFTVIRLPEKHDKLYKTMVKNLAKQPGLKVKADVGMAGRPRICVAGKIWKTKKNWEPWWEKLPNKIENAYKETIKQASFMKEISKRAFHDELEKMASKNTKKYDSIIDTVESKLKTFGITRSELSKHFQFKAGDKPGALKLYAKPLKKEVGVKAKVAF